MRNPKVVFVAGSVVSLAVTVVTGVFLDISTGVLAGLMSEALTTILVLWVRVSEVEEGINADITRVLDLVSLYRKVAELDDPLFTEKYKQLLWTLRELSDGQYQLHTLEQVYEDDTRSIELMQNNEVLRSICPLARDTDSLKQQIRNKSYLASIKAHLDAAQRGVRVMRIYAFLDRSLIDLTELREHFSSLVSANVEVYVIFHDDPRFRQAQSIHLDFLVFGDRKVSIGEIDPRTEVVSGARIDTNRMTVEKCIREYNTLLRISERYSPETTTDASAAASFGAAKAGRKPRKRTEADQRPAARGS